MLRALALLLVILARARSSAQDAPPQFVKLAPSTAGSSNAVAKNEVAPDIHACQIPENVKFTAEILLTVTAKGVPDKVTLLNGTGYPCLDDSAILAVKSSTFYPGTKDGAPVDQSIIKLVDLVRYDKDHEPKPVANADTVPPRVIRAPELDAGSCRWKKDTEYKVLVGITVDSDGKPQNATVSKSSGDPCFDAAAVNGAKLYLFRPATREGKPVSFPMKIEMQFNHL